MPPAVSADAVLPLAPRTPSPVGSASGTSPLSDSAATLVDDAEFARARGVATTDRLRSTHGQGPATQSVVAPTASPTPPVRPWSPSTIGPPKLSRPNAPDAAAPPASPPLPSPARAASAGARSTPPRRPAPLHLGVRWGAAVYAPEPLAAVSSALTVPVGPARLPPLLPPMPRVSTPVARPAATPPPALEPFPLAPEDAARLQGEGPHVYGAVARNLRRANKPARAHAVLWAGVQSFRSLRLWNQLLHLHRGSLPTVCALDARMRAAGVARDGNTYTTLLEAHLWAHDFVGAAARLAPGWAGEVALSPSTWRIGAHGFARGGHWRWVADCVDALQRDGAAEDRGHLLGLARCLAETGDVARATTYLAQLQRRGLHPDVEAFGHAIACAVVRDQLVVATDVLLLARQSRILLRAVDWTLLAEGLRRLGLPSAADECLGHLARDGQVARDVVFGVAAAVYTRAHEVDRLAALWAQAGRENVAINEATAQASPVAFAAADRRDAVALCLSARLQPTR